MNVGRKTESVEHGEEPETGGSGSLPADSEESTVGGSTGDDRVNMKQSENAGRLVGVITTWQPEMFSLHLFVSMQRNPCTLLKQRTTVTGSYAH